MPRYLIRQRSSRSMLNEGLQEEPPTKSTTLQQFHLHESFTSNTSISTDMDPTVMTSTTSLCEELSGSTPSATATAAPAASSNNNRRLGFSSFKSLSNQSLGSGDNSNHNHNTNNKPKRLRATVMCLSSASLVQSRVTAAAVVSVSPRKSRAKLGSSGATAMMESGTAISSRKSKTVRPLTDVSDNAFHSKERVRNDRSSQPAKPLRRGLSRNSSSSLSDLDLKTSSCHDRIMTASSRVPTSSTSATTTNGSSSSRRLMSPSKKRREHLSMNGASPTSKNSSPTAVATNGGRPGLVSTPVSAPSHPSTMANMADRRAQFLASRGSRALISTRYLECCTMDLMEEYEKIINEGDDDDNDDEDGDGDDDDNTRDYLDDSARSHEDACLSHNKKDRYSLLQRSHSSNRVVVGEEMLLRYDQIIQDFDQVSEEDEGEYQGEAKQVEQEHEQEEQSSSSSSSPSAPHHTLPPPTVTHTPTMITI
ncbi:hypothetical protein ACA910_014735 [Epithemia clementina (nom. ined.)]